MNTTTYYQIIEIVLGILFLHWYCDFSLQTPWQAENKSKNNLALLSHVATYTLGMFLGLLLFFGDQFKFENIFFYSIANGFVHFCIDYTTSRVTSSLYKQQKVHDFFVVIGFDQFMHNGCLLASVPILFVNIL